MQDLIALAVEESWNKLDEILQSYSDRPFVRFEAVAKALKQSSQPVNIFQGLGSQWQQQQYFRQHFRYVVSNKVYS